MKMMMKATYVSKQEVDYKLECTANTWGASWVLKVDGYTATFHIVGASRY
jgi:hypothetical protein